MRLVAIVAALVPTLGFAAAQAHGARSRPGRTSKETRHRGKDGPSVSSAPGVTVRARVVEERADRAIVDWTAGRLLATGAGAPDLRAPSPAIARIGAERAARKAARARLAERARELPWAGGGSLGERLAADPGAASRIEAVLARPDDADVRYFSDGAVEVTLAIPLEALRVAVAPPEPPVGDDTAPTALVVEADRLRPSPALGLALVAGDVRYAGPTIYHRDRGAAASDPRLGPRPTRVLARAVDPERGTLAVALDDAALAAAARAGALVVVVASDPVRRAEGRAPKRKTDKRPARGSSP